MSESPRTLITTRLEFHDALRLAFSETSHAGSRELFLCDEDFADWPLNEPEIIAALTRWAMPHRKLWMLARHYDEVTRRHPRFVEWRRTWSHVMECRAAEEVDSGDLPTLFLAPSVVCVRLFDRIQIRGSLSHDTADFIRDRELFDAVSQRSEESFPASTLGL